METIAVSGDSVSTKKRTGLPISRSVDLRSVMGRFLGYRYHLFLACSPGAFQPILPSMEAEID